MNTSTIDFRPATILRLWKLLRYAAIVKISVARKKIMRDSRGRPDMSRVPHSRSEVTRSRPTVYGVRRIKLRDDPHVAEIARSNVRDGNVMHDWMQNSQQEGGQTSTGKNAVVQNPYVCLKCFYRSNQS